MSDAGEQAVPRNPSPNPEEHHASEQNTEQTVQSDIIRVCASTVEEYQRDEIPKPVAESLKFLQIYATDIKGTKLHLVNSVGAPEFPDSEWNNILLGQVVDLNRVFTGHYAASAEKPQSESVGELEICFKPASPAKRITASGEWVLSWNKASAAMVARLPLHHRLLKFDQVMRKRVGSRQDLLLTDYVRFADLKIQFLDSAGANVYNTQENRTGGAAGGVRLGARPPKGGVQALEHQELSFPHQRNDPVVNATLRAHPDLFKIVTPINVDRLKALTLDHPNQPFVCSVLRSLCRGFWPFADSKPDFYLDTWDEKRPPPDDAEAQDFLCQQCAEEVRLGRYSEPFGRDLLPGMYAMPTHAVPKPHSSKLRLVNDLSAGAFSLHSMIQHNSLKGTVLDGISALGAALHRFRYQHGPVRLTMWKWDVSQAYRQMPMSPYWQIRQIVTVDDLRHIDRCNLFGDSGSLKVWAAFNALVNWIAEHKLDIADLLNYIDNDYSFDVDTNTTFLPSGQARLLRLWDELGVPHDRAKQVANYILPIIGFNVDPNTMIVTLPDDAQQKLLAAIDDFCDLSPGNHRRSLHDFQSFAGYANWWFNIFPLLKPGLASLYAKLAGKTSKHTGIYVNAAIIASSGGLLVMFVALPVFISSMHSLRAHPPYNNILMSAVDVLLKCNINLRVDHVPGELNIIADALSHRRFKLVHQLVPNIDIIPFIPPPDALAQPLREPWSLERLVHKRAIALGHALDKSTGTTYSSALNSYLTFCKIHSFPVEPTPDTLSFFVTFMCRHIEPRSVNSYLSGVCSGLEPWFPDIRNIRSSQLVSRTLRGCMRLYSKPIKRKCTLLKDDLTLVLSLTPPNSALYDDLLFATMLFTGFHALLLLGEMVWPDQISLRTYRKVTLRHSVEVAADTFTFLLPTHKADSTFKGNHVLVQRTQSSPDPYTFFTAYLARRGSFFPCNPALWLRADGSIPVRAGFMKRLHAFFPADISGHSMHAGGATSLAAAGVPPAMIQAIG
ncbi:hypothetical protein VTO73DRAFT_5260 [Trametes versicolor]